MWIYVIGLAALGGASGFLVGASASPVVGILLPLLFGLVAGVAGFYSARVDIASVASQRKLKLLGSSLISFCVALIAAVLATLSWRDIKVESNATRPTQIDLSGVTPEDALRLVGLRRRLQILGSDGAEQTKILALWKQDFTSIGSNRVGLQINTFSGESQSIQNLSSEEKTSPRILSKEERIGMLTRSDVSIEDQLIEVLLTGKISEDITKPSFLPANPITLPNRRFLPGVPPSRPNKDIDHK